MKDLEKFIEHYGGYWKGECPEAPVSDWQFEVKSNDTRLGYWEWAHKTVVSDMRDEE